MPFAVVAQFLGQLRDELRTLGTRPDQAHVADEHIDQLRQFIDVETSHECAQFRASRVVLHGPARPSRLISYWTRLDTPDNTQDTNVFTFGPAIRWPLSRRQTLTFNPSYRNFYYEEQDTDNQQLSLTASWFYQMYRLTGVGLDGGVTRFDYDDEQRKPDYTTSNIHLVVAGRRARSEFDINLGATNIGRDEFESQNGFSGNLTWLLTLTGHSRLRA